MATLESKTQTGVAAEVEPTFGAVRVIPKPLEYQQFGSGGIQRTLGHYKFTTGGNALAPTNGAVLWAFRYPDPGSLAVIFRIYTWIDVVTAVTAQRVAPLAVYVLRGFTGPYTTNISNVAPQGNAGKMRTSMSTSQTGGFNAQVATIQTATAAAGMTGPTASQDGNAIGICYPTNIVGLGTGMPVTDLYKWDKNSEHPLVLSSNEGVIVPWGAVTLATGSVSVGFGIDWAEVAEF